MKQLKYKNICAVSGSRADYGILSDLFKKIKKNKNFKLKLIITGSHLSTKYGNTINEIKKDNISIFKKIKILSKKNTKYNLIKSSSKAISEYGNAFKRLLPDALIILGDRYEIFCAAYAAVIYRIPVIHFHGGELTLNSYDDYFRHAITKLSNIHFVSTSIYRDRLIKMGEMPNRVFNVGSIGLENIKKTSFLKKEEIEKRLKFKLKKRIVLFSLHPETLNLTNTQKQIKITLSVLEKLKNTSVIITMPNDDLNSDKIINSLKTFARQNNNVHYFKSLGRFVYLSCMKISDFVIGNSSSGIIEAPSLNKYSIDLGKRQSGREKAFSVYSCDFNKKKINLLIKKIYKKKNIKIKNPYFKKNSINKVISTLKKVNFKLINNKKFYEK